MANNDQQFKKVLSHARVMVMVNPVRFMMTPRLRSEREFKENIRDNWWQAMTQLNQDIVGIDAILCNHLTWKASGHVDASLNPLIDNKDSKTLSRRRSCGDYREKYLQKKPQRSRKAIRILLMRPCIEKPTRVMGTKQAKEPVERLANSLEAEDPQELRLLLKN
jgi:glycyl-tRNA synthetase